MRDVQDFRRGFELCRTQLDCSKDLVFLQSSHQLGWSNLQAAVIETRPFESVIANESCLFVVMPLVEVDLSFFIESREERYRMPAGRVCILAPGTVFRARLGNPARSLGVTIESNVLSEVAGELSDARLSYMEVTSTFGAQCPSMTSLLHVVMAALSEPPQSSTLKIEYLARALAASICAKYATQRRRPCVSDTTSRLGTRQLRRTLEYIEENLASDISLNELAAVAGLGRTTFIQRFKRTLKQTPHRYLLSARLHHGQDLLARSDLPITCIAAICGFADHAHFSTVFKREFGVTPSEYKQARQ